jgi:endonuclease/exonuclease/phosphatase family metal-dependent hydrolase
MERTNYPERSRTIARLLDRERPDVIGLQEVALWETAPLGSSSWTTTYDFLQLTLDALAARGAHYRVAAVNTNFTNANLPFPIPISATTQARFTDRDVILVRVGRPWRPVVATNPVSRNFAVSLPLSILGQTISVQRGWSSVDVRIRDARFRFVNTHLEAFDGPDGPVKVAQATELAAALRASPLPLVVVGDVNSRPDTPGCNNINTRAYAIIAAVGLREVWPAVHRRNPCGGWTSGQDDTLLNPVSTLTHRIDVIFFDPRFFVARHTEVLGERQRDRTRPSGFWPSDHAGVSATLRWLRHRH